MKLLTSTESRLNFCKILPFPPTSKALQISQWVKDICIFKIVFSAASDLTLQQFYLDNIFLVLYKNVTLELYQKP